MQHRCALAIASAVAHVKRGHAIIEGLTIAVTAATGAALVFAQEIAPTIVSHPAAPTVASGLVILAIALVKVIDKAWFSQNDRKTDAVGARVDQLGDRLDGIATRLDKVTEQLAQQPNLHREQREVTERLGRITQRQDKQQKDLNEYFERLKLLETHRKAGGK